MVSNTILATIVFITILVGLIYYLKKKVHKELLIAFLISLSWVLFYGYNYEGTQLFLFGKINLLALSAWTLGLVIFWQVYEKFKRKYGRKKAIIYSGITYIILINIVEWIGYNLLNIKLAPSYPGLLGLDLMHGPWWLKLYYLTVWYIFIRLMEFFEK